MNIREAILKAADHIEANPHRFDFDSVLVPGKTCGSPGCALGWIAAFAGQQSGKEFQTNDLIGCGDLEFYSRMDDIEAPFDGDKPALACHWMNSAPGCAEVLRLYADKYHPAEKPQGIPDNVRGLFTPRVAA